MSLETGVRRALWLALCVLLFAGAVGGVLTGHDAISAITIALGLIAFGLSAR